MPLSQSGSVFRLAHIGAVPLLSVFGLALSDYILACCHVCKHKRSLLKLSLRPDLNRQGYLNCLILPLKQQLRSRSPSSAKKGGLHSTQELISIACSMALTTSSRGWKPQIMSLRLCAGASRPETPVTRSFSPCLAVPANKSLLDVQEIDSCQSSD